MDKKFTINDFQRKKESGEKITILTAYDYPIAKIVDDAGIDAVLVGDSLGMVALGYDSTVPVTMEEMIHHSKAVRKGVKRAFLIADMPFMSYHINDEETVRNAGRFMKEAGCDAVKIEGTEEISSRIECIIRSGIPVLGHIGLTPQTVSKLGGYKVQGRSEEDAKKLLADALSMEECGCFAVVLECVPSDVAGKITSKLKIPTIGIGAGNLCGGQVLVTQDILGVYDKFLPKFVKRYANIKEVAQQAIKKFKKETETGVFPGEEHSF